MIDVQERDYDPPFEDNLDSLTLSEDQTASSPLPSEKNYTYAEIPNNVDRVSYSLQNSNLDDGVPDPPPMGKIIRTRKPEHNSERNVLGGPSMELFYKRSSS